MDISVQMKTIRRQKLRILEKVEKTISPLLSFIYRQTVVIEKRSSTAKRAKNMLQLNPIIKKKYLL